MGGGGGGGIECSPGDGLFSRVQTAVGSLRPGVQAENTP